MSSHPEMMLIEPRFFTKPESWLRPDETHQELTIILHEISQLDPKPRMGHRIGFALNEPFPESGIKTRISEHVSAAGRGVYYSVIVMYASGAAEALTIQQDITKDGELVTMDWYGAKDRDAITCSISHKGEEYKLTGMFAYNVFERIKSIVAVAKANRNIDTTPTPTK